MNRISVEEFAVLLQRDEVPKILDVREELEYYTFNIGAKNIPLGKLNHVLEDLDWDTEEEIIVLCQHGIRSKTACQILSNAGFNKVRNLEGGLVQWRKMMAK
ncbi:MAG: rhodanese-like domain-containing protein [Sphingobacteriaceae bacterium]